GGERLQDGGEIEIPPLLLGSPERHRHTVRHVEGLEPMDPLRRRGLCVQRETGRGHRVQEGKSQRGPETAEDRPAREWLARDDLHDSPPWLVARCCAGRRSSAAWLAVSYPGSCSAGSRLLRSARLLAVRPRHRPAQSALPRALLPSAPTPLPP